MIVVDSSVWINYFNGKVTPQTLYLRDRANRKEIIVGDLILCEVLQGFRNNKDFDAARSLLLSFKFREIVGQTVALESVKNYRLLRERGITIRKTIDVLIGTFCIVNDFYLLHTDSDFDPMKIHLGLRVIQLDN